MTTEVLALSGRGLTQSFGDRRLLWGSFVCFRPKQNGSTVYDGAFPRESKAAGSSQATYPYFEVVSGDEPSFKVMLLCWMHPFRILAFRFVPSSILLGHFFLVDRTARKAQTDV